MRANATDGGGFVLQAARRLRQTVASLRGRRAEVVRPQPRVSCVYLAEAVTRAGVEKALVHDSGV